MTTPLDTTHQMNLNRYNDDVVVGFYEKLSGLERYEKDLFERNIPHGARILDIGVGAGRTTPWLSARASTYLGVDYALAMVNACRRKYPHLDFIHMDATDLSAISSASIDVVVFSFNGIDYIHPKESREKCLREVNRVLASDGLFIFSEHNARRLIVKPDLQGASLSRSLWRILRSVILTFRLIVNRLSSPVLRAGSGYETDPVHGGLVTYSVTPATVANELIETGFNLVETICVDRVKRSHSWVTPWYYFAARKYRSE